MSKESLTAEEILTSDKSGDELVDQYFEEKFSPENNTEEVIEDIVDDDVIEEREDEIIESAEEDTTVDDIPDDSNSQESVEEIPAPAEDSVIDDIYNSLNKLNNPDNIDAPEKGMLPYRENGETKWTSVDDFNSKFHMGSNYTKKMQELSGVKSKYKVFDDIDVKPEDVAILKQLKNGNTEEAMLAVSQAYNLDANKIMESVVDINDEKISGYNMPQAPQSGIQRDPQVDSFYSSLPEQDSARLSSMVNDQLPSSVSSLINGNAELTTAFAYDVASGKADHIIAQIQGELNGISTFEQKIFLNDPMNYFKLYEEVSNKLGAQPSQAAPQESLTRQQNPVQAEKPTVSQAEIETLNRLNSSQHVVEKSTEAPARANTVNDILTKDGYVDAYIKENYRK